jgi:DNA topoisomerase IA
VGYELSPVLWRKLKDSGRVQSGSLFVERERDIQNFNAVAVILLLPSLPMNRENHLRQS